MDIFIFGLCDDGSRIESAIARCVLAICVDWCFLARNEISPHHCAQSMKVIVAIKPLDLFAIFRFVAGI